MSLKLRYETSHPEYSGHTWMICRLADGEFPAGRTGGHMAIKKQIIEYMKIALILLVSVFCLSFRPSTEKAESNSRPGFYIFVEDYTDRTYHKYIGDSKDSVDIIFNRFFDSELELGDVDHPISIYNGKRNFYIARVTLFETPEGKTKFRNLKYSSVYLKRAKLKPVVL